MYYEEKRKDKEKLIMYCFMVLIIALLLVLILRNSNTQLQYSNNYTAEKLNYDENTNKKFDEINLVDEFDIENATESIVGISKIKQTGTSVFINNAEQKLGLGSGVIITDNGYILTNQHVAGNKYSSCYVSLSDGKIYEGNEVWADSNIDLAIVKINKSNLSYLEFGDSDNLKLAEEVYAIGNPLGLDFQKTITKGIISALNRTIKLEDNETNVYMEDLIQTDATINQGNSGGALINNSGKLIGINSVKISNAEGIGFAVPINIVKPIINKLVNNNRFDEAWLGIYGYDKEAIQYLDSNIEIESGVYVAQIAVDGPAFGLDIKEGDVITKIDDVKINKMNELKKYIYSKSPNDFVTLHIKRNNREFSIDVKLWGKS